MNGNDEKCYCKKGKRKHQWSDFVKAKLKNKNRILSTINAEQQQKRMFHNHSLFKFNWYEY